VITDFSEGDQIVLCGQNDTFFFVTKIEFVATAGGGVKDDVIMSLSNGQRLIVENAAGEFERGISQNGSNVADLSGNVGNFLSVDEHDPAQQELEDLYCDIDCRGPKVHEEPLPVDFCVDLPMGELI
jgi:hypothetical protein